MTATENRPMGTWNPTREELLMMLDGVAEGPVVFPDIGMVTGGGKGFLCVEDRLMADLVSEGLARSFELRTEHGPTTITGKFYCPTEAGKAAIAKLKAEAAEARIAEAYDYAVRLFAALAPQCKPLDDLMGVLSQIDNASTEIPILKTRIAMAIGSLAEVLPYPDPVVHARLERVIAALTGTEPAPGHTDLMVSPESIDAFMETSPLPEESVPASSSTV